MSSVYRAFVQKQMREMSDSNLSPQEKMKRIGALWREQGLSSASPAKKNVKKRTIRGGAVTDILLSSPAIATSTNNPMTPQNGVPQVDPTLMTDNGLPVYLCMHPNQFSRNQNEVILYQNTMQLMQSDFYKKYQNRMKLVMPIKSFNGQDKEKEIPAKPLRFVFHANNFTDKTQMYLDPEDADEYIDIWNQLKDIAWMIPVEFASAQFMRDNKLKTMDAVKASEEARENGYKWGLYDMAVQKNKDIDNIYQQRNKDIENIYKQQDERQNWMNQLSQANQNASYYKGQTEGMDKQGDISAKLASSMPQTTVNVDNHAGGGGGGGGSNVLGDIAEGIGSIFGLGFNPKTKHPLSRPRKVTKNSKGGQIVGGSLEEPQQQSYRIKNERDFVNDFITGYNTIIQLANDVL
jgi:hypothetical protein